MLRRERQTSGNFPNAPTIAEAGEWTKYSTAVAGTLLALVGLFVPSASIIAFLNSDPGPLQDELLLGATLLRAGLVLLGVIVVGLGRLPVWRTPPRATAVADETRTDIYTWLLGGVLLVSTALRLVALNSGLWIDEILTYMNYARLPMGQLVSTYADENQHFLFSILARISFVLFGESAWALRLPAVLFGVGSIWALYQFGRYVSNEREGLLAAALLAFSYHHLWFSQNARGYTGLLFWSILASWIFLRALNESRARLWLLYAIAAALGMYTHMTMMFVIFSHLVIYLVTLFRRRRQVRPQRWLGFFVGFGLAGFLTLLLYAIVLPQMLTAIAETQSVVAEWRNPLWTLLELANGLMVSFGGGPAALGGVIVAIALILFGAGILSYWRSNANVLAILFLPAVAGASITVGLGHHLWPRFFFFTFGFGALVVVRGVIIAGTWAGRALKLSPSKAAWIGPALCLAMITASAASMVFAYGPKQDYEGALAYVEANRAPGDAVVAVGLADHIYQNFQEVGWPTVDSASALDALRDRSERTWVLYTFVPVLESRHPDILARLREEFEVVERFPGTVRQGTIFVAVDGRLP